MNRVVKRVMGIVASVALLVGGIVSADGTALASGARGTPGNVAWAPCPSEPERATSADLECATVRVPLDYREPMGQAITLAINRIKAKVSRDANHLGTLLVNPGGPGASGRELTEFVAAALPQDVSERYDIVGFDPRGVGGSEPAVHCVDPESYFRAPRPDAVPHGEAEERVLLSRAADYANRCGNHWAWLLPYLTTENSARDMDSIRAALGEEKISYLGYSYGTYLGAVYATLFPSRVKRLVMDSTIDPTLVWYESNLRQDSAFEHRHRQFLAWTARHNSVYKLGATAKQTSFAYYAMRDRLHARPAGGIVGPSELDDIFTTAGYSDRVWPEFAQAWSSYVRQGDVGGLLGLYEKYGKDDAKAENGYAIYLGVQCTDAKWPREWDKWKADMTRMHRRAPFMTWPNAWFNAPCLYWSAPGGTPVDVKGSRKLPPILMIQSRDDAATPYKGALEMRRHFDRATMVVEGGGNHGVSLAGNTCVDNRLAAYLRDGTLPRRDVECPALPEPKASQHMAAENPSGGLLGLLGLLQGI
ncbi:alpha/beta hydrolase [Nonomuraea sp. NPDC049695]|uniref:alpha/beta hydrolase n=1 Tax=Nonomuraea sp. NPDC049695 TaxID=3154734 RepID=UPI00343C9769